MSTYRRRRAVGIRRCWQSWPVLSARMIASSSGEWSLMLSRNWSITVNYSKNGRRGWLRHIPLEMIQSGRELYLDACEARREQRLAPLLAHATQFVLTRHQHIPSSWKYTEVLSDAQTNQHRYYRPGATLNLLEMDGVYARMRTLVDDATVCCEILTYRSMAGLSCSLGRNRIGVTIFTCTKWM